MADLYDAARSGDLERVMLLVEQGAEKDKTFGSDKQTALIGAYVVVWHTWPPRMSAVGCV